MQVASVPSLVRRSASVIVLLCAIAASPICANARAHEPAAVDTHFLQELEARAALAAPREQATLYADLADKMTVVASQQISAGEMEAAEQTLLHLEACTVKIKGGLLQNSKGLKKAELMLHTTQRRLQDLARISSAEIRPRVQSAMKQLDSVQTALLGMIFDK